VTSPLSAVPAARRRRAAATVGLLAMLFVAVGAVALTGGPDATVRVFAIVALVAAGALALISWGLLHSVRLDVATDAAIAAEASLDAAIEQALAESGRTSCDCGHDHDASEMHVQKGCAHDGAGTDCAHDCDTCALAALRPSPTATRAERLPR
jgi:hypothetical protein